ncbi:MAG: VCBS repeat-containing protein, partial [Chromatiaceae bacterium]
MDGDGRLDIAFTSHGENFSQVFYQRAARGFEAGPRIMAVGFHPGNLIKLPIAERSAYLMSGEGAGRLYTLEAAEDGSLAVVAQARVPSPRFATTFRWPGWGLGIMAVPFMSPSVILLKQYDPHAVKAAQRVDLQISGTAFPPQSVASADLDGDGADELILPLYDIGMLKVIRYPGPDSLPRMETLWDSPRLGPVKYVVAADVNSDGLTDLLAPQEAPKPEGGDQAVVNVLLNDGKGSFGLVELPFPTRPRAKGGMPGIRALDTAVDRDGSRYIFAAGYQAYTLYQLAPGIELSAAPSRQLPFEAKEGIFKALLRDVDGDGWLDAVVARGRDQDAGLVIFGPLWEHFAPGAIDLKPAS